MLCSLSSYACIEKWKIGWSLKMMNYNSKAIYERKTAFSVSADDLLNYFLVRINFKDYFYISFLLRWYGICRVDITSLTQQILCSLYTKNDGRKISICPRTRFSHSRHSSFLYTILRLLVTIGFSTGNIDPRSSIP